MYSKIFDNMPYLTMTRDQFDLLDSRNERYLAGNNMAGHNLAILLIEMEQILDEIVARKEALISVLQSAVGGDSEEESQLPIFGAIERYLRLLDLAAGINDKLVSQQVRLAKTYNQTADVEFARGLLKQYGYIVMTQNSLDQWQRLNDSYMACRAELEAIKANV